MPAGVGQGASPSGAADPTRHVFSAPAKALAKLEVVTVPAPALGRTRSLAWAGVQGAASDTNGQAAPAPHVRRAGRPSAGRWTCHSGGLPGLAAVRRAPLLPGTADHVALQSGGVEPKTCTLRPPASQTVVQPSAPNSRASAVAEPHQTAPTSAAGEMEMAGWPKMKPASGEVGGSLQAT